MSDNNFSVMRALQATANQRAAVEEVITMVNEGTWTNTQMLKVLTNGGFSYEDAAYALGYIKDNWRSR